MKKLLSIYITIIIFICGCCTPNTTIEDEEKILNTASVVVYEDNSQFTIEEMYRDWNQIWEKEKELCNMEAETEKYIIIPSTLKDYEGSRRDALTNWMRSVEILYPQIYLVSNDYDQSVELERKINQVLFQNGFNIIGEAGLLEREKEYITIHYDITQLSERMISLCYYGFRHIPTRSYSYICGITIDLESGEAMALSNFLSVDKYLLYVQIANNEFEIINNVPPFELQTEGYIDTFIKQESHINDFYIKDDRVCLVIPTSSNYGFYTVLNTQIQIY